MPLPIRIPSLPPAGFDFAPVPEGESGLDIQISPGRMGGGGNTFDTAIAGAELQYGECYFNFTNTADMRNNPANYAGTFMTDFSGRILAGRRLDGLQPVLPALAWDNSYPYNPALGSIVRTGNNSDIKVISGGSVATGGIYSPGGGTGLDVFYFPATYAPKKLSLSAIQFGTTTGTTNSFSLVLNDVPVIINNPNLIIAGYTNVSIPNIPIKTRPRPEGYNPGEKGLQIFINLLNAANPQPAPFQPLPGGFPYNTFIPASIGVPMFQWNIV